ncbi:hypothetical protein [Paenibacillus radicis (ex Gao et al. 2016)]|uniref:Uncharacterized protein n=1 Tax=Paenibacillus radicis (ex Gao et al. 2016) TaxID=1737354 RepID=A0A917H2D6_9BACL|nr:hypothetical protein [Paenibacillus radicis (ex Gao et al. 2016)]GGG64707.1 hypothetical protein GCM10010918_18550 [Paenibacillus radicis (ex Gao et al. 2016)]
MLTRIIRSPLLSLTLFLSTLGLAYLLKLMLTGELSTTTGRIYCAIFVIPLGVLWVLLVRTYNRRNPKDRISVWAVIPFEIREVDEGQQWISFKACRNVYIYYGCGLPFAAIIILLIPPNAVYTLITFGLLGLGQFLVYGLTMWKYSRV